MTGAIEAIDVHAHFGSYRGAKLPLTGQLLSGEVQVVLERARLANTKLTVVSPLEALTPRPEGDPVSANAHAAEVIAQTEGLLQWVVVDPLEPQTFDQAAELLRQPKTAGIKIHPEEHNYPIGDHGEAIFRFAAEHDAVVQTHSGDEKSMPADFLGLADAFPEVTLIISHLGCGWDNDLSHQVRAIQQSRHGNIFTDTSSAKSITSGLIEWAVSEIGADRILYGTDSPLYFAPMQRARIDKAQIGDQDKRLILHDNATRLFGFANE